MTAKTVKTTSNTQHKDQPRLLIVDDIETNRRLMSKQLDRHGYDVDLAEDGPMALEMVEEGHFDLVLLDIRMPNMDGLEVLRRLRKKYSALSLPVIMVTAEDLTEVIVEALQIGANDYLVKPMNVTVAVARIEAQLNLAHMATIKDNIVHFASHDLKKPLIVMLDITETLLEQLQPGQPAPDDSQELLGLIRQTGQNMQGVINGFLDQENLRQEHEERGFQPIDINTVALTSVENNSQYANKKGIRLTHQFAANLPLVDAHEFRLIQILDNLIGNALKFCPEGSIVEVRTEYRNNEVYVKVGDNGPGLAEEDFPRLFIKHAKLSNQPTGGETSSGVGLALCKELIKLDDGNIGARNNPDSGATFWISLPGS